MIYGFNEDKSKAPVQRELIPGSDHVVIKVDGTIDIRPGVFSSENEPYPDQVSNGTLWLKYDDESASIVELKRWDAKYGSAIYPTTGHYPGTGWYPKSRGTWRDFKFDLKDSTGVQDANV